jgi:alkylhydroperoxidase family enzyme
VGVKNVIGVPSERREIQPCEHRTLNHCACRIDMHSKRARKALEAEQRLYALAAWKEAPFFVERERAALALADVVTLSPPRLTFDPRFTERQRGILTRRSWRS